MASARLWARLLPFVLVLLACGPTTTVVISHPTPAPTRGHTPTATPTPSGPPPHAFAWTQYDTHNVPQIWASINGAVPMQITHLAPPPPSDIGCGDPIVWSPPVFSPDLRHIVAATGSSNCGDGVMSGPLYVIDATSGGATPVPDAQQVRTTERAAGWIDNSTVYWIDASGLHTYVLGAGSSTALPGLSNAQEAVLRGNTLFYLQIDGGGFGTSLTWPESLHRYDMTSHAVLPGSISLSQYRMCACSPGDFHTAGWDASPDGTHVVYQLMVPLTGTQQGLASSQIMYASADGSGATHIAQTLNATGLVGMQFAPGGQQIAIASNSAFTVLASASVSSPGGSGDASYHTYTPAGVTFPVWKWDNSQFWAGTQVSGGFGGPSGSLYDYTVANSSSAVGVSGGYNPWYSIGR